VKDGKNVVRFDARAAKNGVKSGKANETVGYE
jgi:hypothetical protein